MFAKTNNPYRFQYLITGITGPGIQEVYLPEQPADHLIEDLGGRVWKRQGLPKDWKKWEAEEAAGLKEDPEHVHPEKNAYVEREWDRRLNGLWFWQGDTATYITGFFYYYLEHFQLSYGYPEFRQPDKEVTYYLKWNEENPNSYGLLYNTLRRAGKSSLMGAWITERITRTKNANGGIQGEKTVKAAQFFNASVLYPFRKLMSPFRPEYDKDSKNKSGIDFFKSVKRGRKKDEDFDGDGMLESKIDYRDAGVLSYDGEKIHTIIFEEPGKTKECDVYERWMVVKFTLEENSKIWGKMFSGTTTEDLNGEDGAGDNYWRLYADSDCDEMVNGKTKSGLFSCFIPADCGACGALGYLPYDKHGHPYRDINRTAIMADREAQKDNPSLLAGLIRKKPLDIQEAFYSDSNQCEFNVMVLEERKAELRNKKGVTVRGGFEWVGGVRDSGKVIFVRDDKKGRFEVSWLFENPSEANQIAMAGKIEGVQQWKPLNDRRFAMGTDPIQHGATMGNVRSMAAAHVFRKYDSAIDGVLTPELLEERRINRYQYKTNLFVCQYHGRPEEPTVYFEDMIKACVYFGCQLHVESQKNAIMSHFRTRGYKAFIMNRPDITYTNPNANKTIVEGTPGSKANIELFTSLIATHVHYFGHRLPFDSLIKNLLSFTPAKPTKFDLVIAMGYALEAAEAKTEKVKTAIDLSAFFNRFDNSGTTSRRL